VEPVRVPQNLHLDDVLFFGLGAVDLLCVAVGAFIAWWLYLYLPVALPVRLALACPALLAAFLLGAGRLGDQTARGFLTDVALYLRRPRLRLYGVKS